VVTLADLGKVPRERLPWESVLNVMTPWQRLHIVSPATPLLEALELMDDTRVSTLPVMEGEAICGLLTREEVLHYIRLRMGLRNR
jgi:CBS domain-containing protein